MTFLIKKRKTKMVCNQQILTRLKHLRKIQMHLRMQLQRRIHLQRRMLQHLRQNQQQHQRMRSLVKIRLHSLRSPHRVNLEFSKQQHRQMHLPLLIRMLNNKQMVSSLVLHQLLQEQQDNLLPELLANRMERPTTLHEQICHH